MSENRKTLSDIARAHMPPGFLSSVFQPGITFKGAVNASGLTDHHDATDNAGLLQRILEDLRLNGHLSPVSNLGDRNIRIPGVWNDFVRNGIAGMNKWDVGLLDEVPLALALRTRMIWTMSGVSDLSMRDQIPTELMENLRVRVERELAEIVSGQSFPVSTSMMECDITGTHLNWGKDLMRPSLCDHDENEVEMLRRPKMGRHITLEAPSGVLCLVPSPTGDGLLTRTFRMVQPGSRNEGYSGVDFSDAGETSRARELFEATGGLYVTISAQPSTQIVDKGVHRFVRMEVEREHRMFHSGAARDKAASKGLQRIEGGPDLWKPILIDRERLRGMLDREASEEAGSAYARLHRNGQIREIGLDGSTQAHIYLPSPGSERVFGRQFRCPETAVLTGASEHFLISKEPLTVPEGKFQDLDMEWNNTRDELEMPSMG